MQISVVIPVFNASEFIAGCIDSVVQQVPAPVEIICIDDCSTDNSRAIIESYQKKHGKLLKFIPLEKNAGAPHARNLGMKMAIGDYIQFLDADDYLLPGKFAHQLNLIEKNNQPDFIAAAYTRIALDKSERKIQLEDGNEWFALLSSALGCTCSNLWKREAVLKIGGFRESFASSQEYGLMFDLLKNSASVVVDQEIFTKVRDQETGKSISKKNPAVNWTQYVKVRIETMHFLETNKLIQPEEKNKMYQPLFGAIRILYNFSSETAMDFFRNHIPADFKPMPGPGITESYCKFYSRFGFASTEKLRSIARIFKGGIKG